MSAKDAVIVFSIKGLIVFCILLNRTKIYKTVAMHSEYLKIL